MIKLEKRVSNLEMALERFINQTNYSLNKLSQDIDRLTKSIEESKKENNETIEKLSKRIDEYTKQTNEIINNLSEEMKEFKNEMNEYKNESNRRMSYLEKKFGTLVEDIVVQGCDVALKKKFNVEIIDLAVRVRKRKGNYRDEFDIIAVGDDDKIYMIEVKSKPESSDVKETIEKCKKLKENIYNDKEVIPILASIYMDESIIKYAKRKNLYIMIIKGDYLEIIN